MKSVKDQVIANARSIFSCCFQASSNPYDYDNTQPGKARIQRSRDTLASSSCSRYEKPPPWTKDDSSICCTTCMDQFDLFTRKHHCRCCGLIFCHKCAGQYERIIKYGMDQPVRVCTTCWMQAKTENVYYERYLPILENGTLFVKYGLIRTRSVELWFLPQANVFQYRSVNLETRQYEGETKTIALDAIISVQEVSIGEDNADVGFRITTRESKEYRFDAKNSTVRRQWMNGIQVARDVRCVIQKQEKERRAREVEVETAKLRQRSEEATCLEKKISSFQQDRRLLQAQRRGFLRAKYNLSTTAAS
ncbi:hypothetical protein ABG067_004286 [Albugo candida]